MSEQDRYAVGSGVWIAFYSDRSGVSAWATELEALREAVGAGMEVAFRRWGEDLFTGETRG